MPFTTAEEYCLRESGFRKISNFFKWEEAIAGVRYITVASKTLYQLVPLGESVQWAVLTRPSGPKSRMTNRVWAVRSALASQLPPVQFTEGVYAQCPCRFNINAYVRDQSSFMMSQEVFFGNNVIKEAATVSSNILSAFNSRHPEDPEVASAAEGARIFQEWAAMKEREFIEQAFAPVQELRRQGKNWEADQLRSRIQIDIDKKILRADVGVSRPIAVPRAGAMPSVGKRVKEAVQPEPAPVQRRRMIILPDDD